MSYQTWLKGKGYIDDPIEENEEELENRNRRDEEEQEWMEQMAEQQLIEQENN